MSEDGSADRESVRKAATVLFRYLSYRQRSLQETRIYLNKKGFSGAVSEAAIKEMQDYGYLDDARLAEEITLSLLRRGYGPRRARKELIDKGVEKNIIERLIRHNFDADSDLKRCAELLAKRADSVSDEIDDKWIRRQASFLSSRGFYETAILKALAYYRNDRHHDLS